MQDLAPDGVTVASPPAGPLAVQRYIEEAAGPYGALLQLQSAIKDLVYEGFPTKAPGTVVRARLAAADEAGAHAAQLAGAIVPPEDLRDGHDHLLAAAAAAERLAERARALGGDDPHAGQGFTDAVDDLMSQLDEWAAVLAARADGAASVMAPLESVEREQRRSLSQHLARFARRSLRPFVMLDRPTPHRLFVAPLLPPYGPLSPPGIWNAITAVSRPVGRVPLLGWLVPMVAFGFGAALAMYYWTVVVLWWLLLLGPVASLVAWMVRRRSTAGRLALLVVASLALVACGGDSEATRTPTAPEQAAQPAPAPAAGDQAACLAPERLARADRAQPSDTVAVETANVTFQSADGTTQERSGVATYELSVPEGWVQEEAPPTKDLHLRGRRADDFLITVASGPISDASPAGVRTYLIGQRRPYEAYDNVSALDGVTPLAFQVAGAQAAAWSACFGAAGAQGRERDFVEQRIAFVRRDNLYELTFQSPQARLDRSLPALREVLASWRFSDAP